jgi:hypothetical protein
MIFFILKIDHVGCGSFASVKKAKYKNKIVAAKIFDRMSHNVDTEFQKEVIISKKS